MVSVYSRISCFSISGQKRSSENDAVEAHVEAAVERIVEALHVSEAVVHAL